jgi:hypothetical protein
MALLVHTEQWHGVHPSAVAKHFNRPRSTVSVTGTLQVTCVTVEVELPWA